MEEYRVENRNGKKRRTFPRSCLRCGKEFWAAKYDPKIFCSPQCGASYRRRAWDGLPENQSYCTKCDKVKDISCFTLNTTRVKGVQSWCKECESLNKAQWYSENAEYKRPLLVEQKKARQLALRTWLIEYFQQHPCVDCGESDILVLDFDHVRGVKEKNVSKLICSGSTVSRIKKEIDKCVVRCANCHRRKTAKERGHWRFNLVE